MCLEIPVESTDYDSYLGASQLLSVHHSPVEMGVDIGGTKIDSMAPVRLQIPLPDPAWNLEFQDATKNFTAMKWL